jgi:hypothetical protein
MKVQAITTEGLPYGQPLDAEMVDGELAHELRWPEHIGAPVRIAALRTDAYEVMIHPPLSLDTNLTLMVRKGELVITE